jgi:hypothetical protein
VIANPVATNFSSETGQADAKTAEASSIAWPYSTDEEQSEKVALIFTTILT